MSEGGEGIRPDQAQVTESVKSPFEQKFDERVLFHQKNRLVRGVVRGIRQEESRETEVGRLAKPAISELLSVASVAKNLLLSRSIAQEDVARLPEVVLGLVQEKILQVGPQGSNPLRERLLEAARRSRVGRVVAYPNPAPPPPGTPEAVLTGEMDDFRNILKAASDVISSGEVTDRDNLEELNRIVVDRAKDIFTPTPKTT